MQALFLIVGMKARLMLSALAWNYRPRPVPDIPVETDVVFKKQSTSWRLRNRKQQSARHNHIPMLMSRITDVVTGKVVLPPITVPAGVAVIGANVPRPTKEDLLAARLTRFAH